MLQFKYMIRIYMISAFSAIFSSIGLCLISAAFAAGNSPINQPLLFNSINSSNTSKSNLELLATLSYNAKEIFYLARSQKWKPIDKLLHILNWSEHILQSNLNEEGTALLPRLEKTIAEVNNSVSAKQRIDTMRNANKITLIEAAIAAEFGSRVPSNVELIDYYSRELEVWSELKDMERLSFIVIRMHLAWQTLIPQLNNPREIKEFAEIMKRLYQAKTPEEYAHLATVVHNETGKLEKEFTNKNSDVGK